MSQPQKHADQPWHDHFRSIARGSFVLVLARVIGMLFGLVLMIFLARSLPPAQLGIVTLCFSTALIGGLLLSGNIGAGAVRFVNAYANTDKAGLAGAYIKFGHRFVLRSAVTIWFLLCIALLGARFGWLPPLPLAIAAGLLVAPLFSWLRVEGANVAATGEVVRAALPGTLLRPALMMSAVLLLFRTNQSVGAEAVLVLYGVTLGVVLLLQWPFFRPVLQPLQLTSTAAPADVRRSWRSVGLDLLIPTLFLELSVDIIVLAAATVLPPAQIAALGIVLRIQAMILFGVTSINMVVSPRIAQAHSAGDRATVNHLLLISSHMKLWPALLAWIVMWQFGQPILGIFGQEYQAYLVPLLIVSVTPILMALIGPIVLFVTVLGIERRARQVFQTAIVLLLGLIMLLGKFFALTGVAIAMVIVWLYWQLALHVAIRRESGYSTIRLRPLGHHS